MVRYMIAAGALWCAISVGLGAFGAHGLKGRLGDSLPAAEAERGLANWETGARYQMYHGLAMLAVGLFAGGALRGRDGWKTPAQSDERSLVVPVPIRFTVAWWCFLAGSFVFSGSLYAMVLGGPRVLGAVVPIGGALQILGWLVFSWSVWTVDSGNHLGSRAASGS